MIASTAFHNLKDCTWCKHRRALKKAIQRRYEMETCSLTGARLAPPTEALRRRCDRFQHENCSCISCNSYW